MFNLKKSPGVAQEEVIARQEKVERLLHGGGDSRTDQKAPSAAAGTHEAPREGEMLSPGRIGPKGRKLLPSRAAAPLPAGLRVPGLRVPGLQGPARSGPDPATHRRSARSPNRAGRAPHPPADTSVANGGWEKPRLVPAPGSRRRWQLREREQGSK